MRSCDLSSIKDDGLQPSMYLGYTKNLLPYSMKAQIAKFMGPTWGPPGSCWPQMGPILAPWTLLSGCGLDSITHMHWTTDCCKTIQNGNTYSLVLPVMAKLASWQLLVFKVGNLWFGIFIPSHWSVDIWENCQRMVLIRVPQYNSTRCED